MPLDSVARVLLVENPSAELIEEAVEVCLRAYPFDASTCAMTGNDETLRRALYCSLFGAAKVAGNIFTVTNRDDGNIMAVAVCEEQRAQGFNDFMASLAPTVRHWWINEYSQGLSKAHALYDKDVALNSWYANVVATDPVYQGKGYGSMLVRAGMRQAADNKTVVALATTTPELVAWYEHLGLKSVGTIEFKGPDIQRRETFEGTWLLCDDPENHT